MTTQVDFYLLATKHESDRRQFCCRLIEKAYRLGNRIHLLTEDEQSAVVFDELLWTFRAGSFVPHQQYNPADNALLTYSPVLISYQDISGTEADVLVNMSLMGPAKPSNYNRIVEIVSEEREVKQAARLRYSQYREQELTLETHQLNTVQ